MCSVMSVPLVDVAIPVVVDGRKVTAVVDDIGDEVEVTVGKVDTFAALVETAGGEVLTGTLVEGGGSVEVGGLGRLVTGVTLLDVGGLVVAGAVDEVDGVVPFVSHAGIVPARSNPPLPSVDVTVIRHVCVTVRSGFAIARLYESVNVTVRVAASRLTVTVPPW